MPDQENSRPSHNIVIVTGPAGAGRTTAINALEDLGFEAIDNLPISLLPRLFAGEPVERAMVIGIDPRNRDFGVEGLLNALEDIAVSTGMRPVLTYLDCDPGVLIRRYSETRRRHPLSPHGNPQAGIEREIALLVPLRKRAEVLIDTSALTVHQLRAKMIREFRSADTTEALDISVCSFSYKRGLPRGCDMVIDVRFLRNPHWEEGLRSLTGRDADVQKFVMEDPSFSQFYAQLTQMLGLLLPAYRREGKSYFGIGLGCTGGKHRSVTVAEVLANTLAQDGWPVSIRHRDLDRSSEENRSGIGVV